MSYSRWGNSVWYTFWCATPSDKRKDQLFEICDMVASVTFTYGELCDQEYRLRNFIKETVIFENMIASCKPPPKLLTNKLPSKDGSLSVTAEFAENGDDVKPLTYEEAEKIYTDAEYDELTTYVKSFMVDVENDGSLDDD